MDKILFDLFDRINKQKKEQKSVRICLTINSVKFLFLLNVITGGLQLWFMTRHTNKKKLIVQCVRDMCLSAYQF